MITGAVKNKVDKIWLDIFSAGLANPLTVIEQLTYLRACLETHLSIMKRFSSMLAMAI